MATFPTVDRSMKDTYASSNDIHWYPLPIFIIMEGG